MLLLFCYTLSGRKMVHRQNHPKIILMINSDKILTLSSQFWTKVTVKSMLLVSKVK